jgi:hypothetical protein
MSKAIIAAVASIAMLAASTPASALDPKAKDFAMAATGLALLTFMCPDYLPNPDLFFFSGKKSLGDDAEDRVARAVGAEITRIAVRGGIKGAKEPDLSKLDPEISSVVDDVSAAFVKLYDDDASSACSSLGDMAVRNGFAQKTKP